MKKNLRTLLSTFIAWLLSGLAGLVGVVFCLGVFNAELGKEMSMVCAALSFLLAYLLCIEWLPLKRMLAFLLVLAAFLLLAFTAELGLLLEMESRVEDYGVMDILLAEASLLVAAYLLNYRRKNEAPEGEDGNNG
ncbi:hypothetical protein [Desulfomicrobium orale]|uniref:Uncharacterized protein n=1 Tax=Desulfomicrobium orale DSM 12838 TaxID=888061 RepID=A0A0X8JR03_9BACT|nr:hypothetical protein [Desulfomicrobium orale]AMD93236.1 hypothetical protein AXF15_09060 [Desulfomicrobium orale DSM 12838]